MRIGIMLGAQEKVGFFSSVDNSCDWSQPHLDAKQVKV
jgi:hypothetical protein